MPTRKTYYRKRAYVKRSYKPKSKGSGRAYRKKYSKRRTPGTGQNGKRFFKVKLSAAITSTGAGVIVGNRTDDPTGFSDFSTMCGLFEEYRVCAIKLKYVPYAPNDAAATRPFPPLFIVWDQDNTTNLASVSEALDYENCRSWDLSKMNKMYVRIPRRSIGSNISIGYTPTSTPAAYGAFKFYGGTYALTLQYGLLITTMYVTMKQRE